MEGLEKDHVNIYAIVQRVVDGIYDGIKTTELDELSAETSAYMNIIHPDYSLLAARIVVSNLHKETVDSIKETAEKLYNCTDKFGRPAPLLAEDVYHVIVDNHEQIQKAIDFTRDFEYDFFGFKTLERAYLLKVDGVIIERPQHMLMRVSIGIHGTDIEKAIETYNYMSTRWFTHATPTLYNSGTPKPQMSS